MTRYEYIIVTASISSTTCPNLNWWQHTWPSGAAALATVYCAVTAILGLVLARERSRRELVALSTAFLEAGMVGGLGYIAAYSRYVVVETQKTASHENKLRFVAGSVRLDGIAAAPDIEMLRDHNYEPERVRTAASLTEARMA